MSTVGYSTLDVIPSVKNLRSQLEQQTSKDFAAAGKRGGQVLGDAAGKEAAGRIKSRLGGVARDAFAPAAGLLAGAGIIEGFKEILSSGSEAQQSIGGVQAVFKQYAAGVVTESNRADQALGLSRTAYQNLATATGALLKNQGIKDFASQTEFLIKRGADLAATFGGPTTDAVDALTAALRGESDPIERYGISLNETAVNAVLAANGQSKLTGAALGTAKAQARLLLIQQQSADAAGAFAREANTQEGQGARLAAQWQNMAATLGGDLLPATQAFTGFLNHDALPALESTGGAVADSVRWFNQLPAPVKAATGALVAFRTAQALGAGSALSAGMSATSRGFEDIRLRAMLVNDEYKRLRAGQLELIQGSGKFTPAAGRMASALGALEVGAIGAGRGLRRGLSGALGLVGGPWGAAFIAGTAIVAHFWQEHQKAKQRVEDFTATLDKETGAITESSKEFAAKQLLDAGVLEGAKRLGVNLELVTNAALGNKDALAAVNAQVASMGNLNDSAAQDAIKLKSALDDSNGVVQKGLSDWNLLGGALGKTTTATGQVTQATETYTDKVKAARTAVQDLLDVENKRRNANLTIFQDRTRIAQALADARKEAADGTKTLSEQTDEGRKNRDALSSLADAWNSAGNSVRNAKGAYADMRQNFIDVATSMGAPKKEAEKLANKLLSIPKKTPAEITTPGMKAALRDLQALRDQLKAIHNFKGERIVITAQATKNQAATKDRAYATGGMIRGPGSGTSDSILMWGSNGEYMQRKAAVDYYGVDFMNALNALRVPKYATGGPVGSRSSAVTYAGPLVNIENMTPANYAEFSQFVQRQAEAARRLAGLDGGRSR